MEENVKKKEEETYSVEADENMKVAVSQFQEALIPIGSAEANKNVFFAIKVMISGVRRRLVDLGTVDAPEGPLKIQLMIFNKEQIPVIMDQLKEEGFKPRTEPGTQYIKVDVPEPTRLQLMDVASDVDRRTQSAISQLNKIKGNTSIRVQKGMENEYIDQRAATKATRNIEKYMIKFEKEVIKAGMIKRLEVLGKYFSPNNDIEKEMFKKLKIQKGTEEAQ